MGLLSIQESDLGTFLVPSSEGDFESLKSPFFIFEF
ncbi:hypothetical protein E2C01_055240 [Portunus trituberculatus]|uniref:Uncharacterized protein n=1 Tax=Portunus trituberculatus TaxID=210409 RepID=A0A5B7GUA5_PORTR|nr:hypothetical protein [Portunus trituberculatus]